MQRSFWELIENLISVDLLKKKEFEKLKKLKKLKKI